MLRKIMVSRIILAAGLLALLYFLILAVKKVDFCIIWLLGGILLCAVGGYLWYRQIDPEGFRLPGTVLAVFGICAALFLAVFVVVEGMILKTMLQKPKENLEYLIVLGAQVKKETPSKALILRLEAALEYLEKNPDTVAVLSGGKGDGEDISEAECMRRYLTGRGVPEKRLVLEDRSTSTFENLKFSAQKLSELTGENLETIKKKQIGLLSNNFHIYRAQLLAKKMGYTQISGIPAPSDWRLQIHYLVREFFALALEKATGEI